MDGGGSLSQAPPRHPLTKFPGAPRSAACSHAPAHQLQLPQCCHRLQPECVDGCGGAFMAAGAGLQRQAL